MNTREILHRYSGVPGVVQLQEILANNSGNPVYLDGVAGSGPAVILASVYSQNPKPLLVLLSDKEEALYFKTDLENLLPGEPVYFLPDSCLKPFRFSTENAMAVQERIETITALRRNNRRILVSYTAAMAELVATQTQLEKNTYEMQKGQKLDVDFLLDFLQENGFNREDFVFEPGQFSLRGGIVDLFSFAHEHPFRIELDGDIVESIRTFDPVTQLSLKEIGFFSLVPNVQSESFSIEKSPVFDYLSEDLTVWISEATLQLELLAKAWEKNLQEHAAAIDSKSVSANTDPREKLLTAGQFEKNLEQYKLVHFGSLRPGGKPEIIEFGQQPQPVFKRNFELLTKWLKENQTRKIETLVFSENSRQIERLQIILTDLNAGVEVIPVYQGLTGGFVDEDARLAFATEHQLFDKYYRPKSRQRYSSNTALTLRELKNLKPGDFVTHIDHGIGRFGGLERMEIPRTDQRGEKLFQEVVRIVYKDNDLLYVSVNSLHKIAKFTGKDGTAPVLNKLGSPAWEKQKKATKKKVKDIARELIELYARRKAQKGFAFAPDNYLQLEMEAGFFYEDTPDQSKASEDV